MSTKPSKVSSSSKRKKSFSGEDSGEERRLTVTEPLENPLMEAPKSQQLFKRVFSEDDEIKLLNAFLDVSKTANASESPSSTAALIFHSVADSFRGQFTNKQLTDKLSKLRGKYVRQINGDKNLKSSHDLEVYRLSEKIWGEEDSAKPRDSGVSPVKGSHKEKRRLKPRQKISPENETPASETQNGLAKAVPDGNREGEKENGTPASETQNGLAKAVPDGNREGEKENGTPASETQNGLAKGVLDGNREGGKENGTPASETQNGEARTVIHDLPVENGGEPANAPVAELALENFRFLMQEVCSLPWNAVLRDRLGSLDESVLKRLDEEWRLQHVAEAKIMAKRAKLVHEHMKLILDSIDSSHQAVNSGSGP